jgi:CheY-like chemotaxis protein
MNNTKYEQTAADSGPHSISTPLRLLILEDNPRDIELSFRELNKAGFELMVDAVDTEEGFAAKLQSRVYDLISADNSIPNWTGVEAFHLLKQGGKRIPFIFVTGTMGEEAAVDLIKEGAADYILKGRLVRLPSAVQLAVGFIVNEGHLWWKCDPRHAASRAVRRGSPAHGQHGLLNRYGGGLGQWCSPSR